VLTARTQQEAKRLGLRLGADDYVTKPFDLEELLLRVEVLLRRGPGAGLAEAGDSTSDHFEFGDVRVDVPARTVHRAGEAVALSRIGFDLLVALLRRRGSAVTRAELMQGVWGYGADVATRTLDTHIFEIRRLIEPNPGAPVHIRTVWRIGYRFE
jgi:DNA-binding response OmpR family regulator